jgi:hypothetical protein
MLSHVYSRRRMLSHVYNRRRMLSHVYSRRRMLSHVYSRRRMLSHVYELFLYRRIKLACAHTYHTNMYVEEFRVEDTHTHTRAHTHEKHT